MPVNGIGRECEKPLLDRTMAIVEWEVFALRKSLKPCGKKCLLSGWTNAARILSGIGSDSHRELASSR